MRYTVTKSQIDIEDKTREDSTIARKNNIVDLEVMISDTAKFYAKSEKVAASGRGRAEWIFRVLIMRVR